MTLVTWDTIQANNIVRVSVHNCPQQMRLLSIWATLESEAILGRQSLMTITNGCRLEEVDLRAGHLENCIRTFKAGPMENLRGERMMYLMHIRIGFIALENPDLR